MTRANWLALKPYINLTKQANQHKPLLLGKRTTRNKAKGVGEILVGSKVKPQVGLETIFLTRK